MPIANVVPLHKKFTFFSETWTPKIVAQVNDYHVKIAKIHGAFDWHSHPETDELFLVVRGSFDLELPDTRLSLQEGDLYVVPRGVRHRPVANHECWILMFEPSGTVNTGDAGEARTVADPEWI